MDEALKFLVHFFNDPQYLFQTITMAGQDQAEEICNKIAANQGWFWPRFAESERQSYLMKRRFVEQRMREEFTRQYGALKETVPVYFYLYPHLTPQKALEMAQRRCDHNEIEPHVLLVNTQELEGMRNVTFTLHDSHASYWKLAEEAGMINRGAGGVPALLPDHNKIFPFSMIEEIYRKYPGQGMYYEVQVWDYPLLKKMRYTVLR